MSSTLLFYGCGSTRIVYDKDKIFKDDSYQNKMPFVMAGGKNNVSGINNKGQCRVAIDVANGFNSTISFSPKKNLLFMFNYSTPFFSKDYNDRVKGPFTVYQGYYDFEGQYHEDSTIYQTADAEVSHTLQQKYMDVASGYYKNLNKTVSFELIGGITYGKATNSYDYDVSSFLSTNFTEERKYIRVYAQPALCINHKIFELGVVTKLALCNFLTQNFTYQYESQLYTMQHYALTAEPSLHLGAGFKRLIFYMDAGWGIPLYKTDVKWQHSKVNVGLSLRLGKWR